MRESITARLDQLRRDYELGQGQLRELVMQERVLLRPLDKAGERPDPVLRHHPHA